MNGTPPTWPPPFPPAGPAPTDDVRQAAAMILVAQAVQRLHAALDQLFIHPKNVP